VEVARCIGDVLLVFLLIALLLLAFHIEHENVVLGLVTG